MATTKKRSKSRPASKKRSTSKKTSKAGARRRGRVDVKKMRKKHAEKARGGDMITVDQGETLFLIHPPCRENDEHEPTAGLPYIPVEVHYGVGGKGDSDGAMVVSLDKKVNPIIKHPFVAAYLRKRKVRILKGGCPVANWLADEAPEDRVDRCARETKYVWGVTPLRYRRDKEDQWRNLRPKPGILFTGPMIHDGIMEAFDELEDITDWEGAVLISVTRTGDRMKTRYKTKADNRTIRRPYKVPAKLQELLEKMMAAGGDCDLFRFVSNMVKGTKDVEKLIAGVKLDDDDDDADDDDDEPRSRRRRSRDDDEPEDDEEEDDEPEEDDEEDDEDEEDEEEDDEEDDEEDEEEDDEEDEEEDEEEDDEEEDDEDEDDEEDEEEDDEDEDDEPETADAEDDGEDDDDDEELEDLNRELAELSAANKQSAKKKAAKKAGAKKAAKKAGAKKTTKKAGAKKTTKKAGKK